MPKRNSKGQFEKPRSRRHSPRESRKYHKRTKKDIPLIPTVLEGGGILLGIDEMINGNITGGALTAVAGVVAGSIVERLGNHTKIGKLRIGISRKHEVSLI